MIAGYHLIWTTYGYWLPNDPRGSMSREIRNAAIADLGELHYGRKRIQPAGRVLQEFRETAQAVLQHPILTFSAAEVETNAHSFDSVIRQHTYTCYACAVMPDHVHLLIRKHRDIAETMIEHFQEESRKAVLELRRREPDHPVWGGPGWKVFLETSEDMVRTIAYIEKNPLKAGLPSQNWPFVKKYDGWLSGQVKIVRKAKPRPTDS